MNYSTNLTNHQWELVKNEFFIGKNAKINRKTLVDSVMFIIKTGNSWRKLPNFFDVNWKSVYSFFMRMKTKKVWKKVLNIIDEDIKNNPNTYNEDTKNIKNRLHLKNNQNNYGFIDKGKKKIDAETYAFLLGIDNSKTENENKIISSDDEDTKNIQNRLQHSKKLKKKNIDIAMYTDLLEMKTEDLEKIVANHEKYTKTKKKQISKINKTENYEDEDENYKTKNINKNEDRYLTKNNKADHKIDIEPITSRTTKNMKTQNQYEKTLNALDKRAKKSEKKDQTKQLNEYEDNKDNKNIRLDCSTKENYESESPFLSLSSTPFSSSFKDFLNSFKPSPNSLKTFGSFPDPKSNKIIKKMRINCQKPTDIEILNNYELIIAFLLQELHIAQTKSHQT